MAWRLYLGFVHREKRSEEEREEKVEREEEEWKERELGLSAASATSIAPQVAQLRTR